MNAYSALNLLGTPVWIVLPTGMEVIFANAAAKELSSGIDLAGLRHGGQSAHAEAGQSHLIVIFWLFCADVLKNEANFLV